MGRRLVIAIICLLQVPAAVRPAVAQTETAATASKDAAKRLESQVQELVRRLDDRELSRREAAEKELVALGPDVLALLPESNNRMPAEMRQRLARITAVLERQSAERTLRPTTVTLSGNVPLSEALEGLAKQTGNALTGHEDRGAMVRTDFRDTPFWEALDTILDQAELTVDPYGGRPNTLVLAPRAGNEQSAVAPCYRGAFRIEALRVFALRDFRNPSLDGMRLAVGVLWEPRLSPVTILQPLDNLHLIGDDGTELSTGMEMGRREVPVHPGMSGVEIELPFDLPSRRIQKLRSVRGTLIVVVPSRLETFTFDGDLSQARGVEQKRAGVTVIVEDVRKNLDLYQVRVRVRFEDAAGALESHRGWVCNNEAFLVDAKGESIPNLGLETTRQTENEVGVAYLFDPPGGLTGCKFVYKSPAMMLRQEVDYELRDVALP